MDEIFIFVYCFGYFSCTLDVGLSYIARYWFGLSKKYTDILKEML